MQQLAHGAQDLLTARQVQQLLHIDRSTVYRMANDGRLAAIRVGRQLRFPAEQLDDLLHIGSTAEAIDPVVAQTCIDMAAELLGVTMAVTDMQGRPLTAIANPSPWFIDHQDSDSLRDCLREWRAMADDPDLAPRFVTASPGFDCARAFIRSGSSLVGMVLAGGVSSPDAPAAEGFHELDDTQRTTVLQALPRIAAALAPRASQSPHIRLASAPAPLLEESQ